MVQFEIRKWAYIGNIDHRTDVQQYQPDNAFDFQGDLLFVIKITGQRGNSQSECKIKHAWAYDDAEPKPD